MLRLGAAVIVMEVVALVVAVLSFGWPVLLVGVPLILGTLLVFVVIRLTETPRERLREHRAARWEPDGPPQRGLMSGFFEAPPADPRDQAKR